MVDCGGSSDDSSGDGNKYNYNDGGGRYDRG